MCTIWMKYLVGAIAVVAMVGAGAALPSHAAPVLDQSFLGGSASVSGDVDFAQTFTVGVAGILSSVELEIFGSANTEVTIDVRGTTSLGVPSLSDNLADQLARATISAPGTQLPLTNINILSFEIAVHSGDVLALVLHGINVHNWLLGLGEDATYGGGQAFLREGPSWKTWGEVFHEPGTPADFHFQTFVAPVPEPGTAAVLVIALGGLTAHGWRRSRRPPSESVP